MKRTKTITTEYASPVSNAFGLKRIDITIYNEDRPNIRDISYTLYTKYGDEIKIMDLNELQILYTLMGELVADELED